MIPPPDPTRDSDPHADEDEGPSAPSPEDASDLPPPLPLPGWLTDAVGTLPIVGPKPCNYLPGREARDELFLTRRLPGMLYHDLMDAGFRRSGQVFYRPACPACRECVPIRVPTAGFRPDKTQRRTLRRNADVELHVGEPRLTAAKIDLYNRFLSGRFGREAEGADELRQFLYSSPVDTLEFTYRLGGELIAASILDVCEKSLSSVYTFFDPDHADRSPGTHTALVEIEWARAHDIPHYYLGFHVRGCGRMSYKSRFRPCELLGPDGVWHEYEVKGAEGKV